MDSTSTEIIVQSITSSTAATLKQIDTLEKLFFILIVATGILGFIAAFEMGDSIIKDT